MNHVNHISKKEKAKPTLPATSFFFQPKLSINQPNDIYEQEADATADKVMRMPGNTEHKFFFAPSRSPLQRKCSHCEEEEKLQRKENNSSIPTTNNEFEDYVSSLDNSGAPLSEEARSFFESKMGHDFSDVKIHNNSAAAKSAQSINALAYTSGNNIVFNEGQFSPETDSGKKLLAHELTHVVQQKSSIAPKVQKFSIERGCRSGNKSAKDASIIRAFYEGEALLGLAIKTIDMLLKSDIHSPLNKEMYGFRYYFHCPGSKELGEILTLLKKAAAIFRNIKIVCTERRSENNIAQYDDIIDTMIIFPEFFETDSKYKPQELVSFMMFSFPEMNWDVNGNTGFDDFSVTADRMVKNEFAYQYTFRHLYSETGNLENAEKLPCLPVEQKKEGEYCGKDATGTGRYVSVADNGEYSVVDGFTRDKGKIILEILHEGNSRFFCFKGKRHFVER